MTLLSLDRLTVQRPAGRVLDRVSLDLAPGEFVGLIGPNGAGKTTLMRAALGLLQHDGHSNLTDMPRGQRARHAAWLPQSREIAWPVTVEALVALGRIPHLPRGTKLRAEDAAAVDAAIARLGLRAYRHRIATELSGGEQARALIARVLAQNTPLVLADEPIAGLDPAAQISTMTVFADLAAEGHGIMASIHDLGLAVRHCTRLVLIDRGRIAADGPPAAVLTREQLRTSFGISAHLSDTPNGPVFQPLEVLS